MALPKFGLQEKRQKDNMWSWHKTEIFILIETENGWTANISVIQM